MVMKKILTAFVCLCAALSFAAAQSSIGVEVHNIVELSEQFNLVFVIEGEHAPSDFSWDAGENFTVAWGPQKGSSTSISIVNGKTSRSTQTSYTYILQARKTGSFTINPATAKVKGKEITSKPVSVKVVDNGAKPSNPSGQNESAQTSSAGSGEVLMRLNLSRSNVVVGEPVTVTLKLYNRASLAGFENARFPSFNGFWSQETESPQNLSFEREELDGKIWEAAVVRKWVIIPQKAGELKIDPAELVCLVNVKQRRRSSSPFDDFFGTGYTTVRQRIYTTSPVISVSPLPAGAPASFGGGVGDFSIKASVSRDSLKVHDAASLKIVVSGKGNVALLEAPKVVLPPDFEVYDSKNSSSGSATQGSRTFEYPFIPRSHGDFTIAPVKYSYYDIKARQYRTVQTDSIKVSVARGAAGTQSVQTASEGTLVVERKGVKDLGQDIRFIKTDTSLGKPSGLFVNSRAYWLCALALLLVGTAFYFVARTTAKRKADVAGTRNRRAAKMALKRLSKAKEYLDGNLYSAFYEELHRALLVFVEGRLALEAANQSKDNIRSAFIGKGISDGLADSFIELLDSCEFARYSPEGGNEAMKAHFDKAAELITDIDSAMKKHGGLSSAAPLAIILLLAGANLQAAESHADSLWKAGTEAFMQENYNSALAIWGEIQEEGLVSFELLYNMGNAYLKSGEPAKAILYYERALRVNPSQADARYNLEYARTLTHDRIEEVPEFFLETWGRNARNILPSNVWAALSMVFLAITLALVLLFLLGRSSGARRAGFFTAIAAFIITFLCWDFAQWQKADAERADLAIVMKPVSPVKSSPSGESAKDLFILHEGTKVRILDSVGGHSNIELADGRQGWIKDRDIEVI